MDPAPAAVGCSCVNPVDALVTIDIAHREPICPPAKSVGRLVSSRQAGEAAAKEGRQGVYIIRLPVPIVAQPESGKRQRLGENTIAIVLIQIDAHGPTFCAVVCK